MKNKITKVLNLLMLLLSLSLYSQNFEELKKTGKPSEPTFVYERPKNCALNTSFLMMDLKQNKDIEYLKNRYSLNEIDNNLYVGAFLKIDKTVFNKTDVESLGVKLNTEAGNFFTALIPINTLESLFEVEGIASVEIAEKVHSTMDSARALTNVNQVQAGTGLPQAYTGNGVIVGVIDGGFDYTHPTFRNLNNSQLTRISKVWEQSEVTTAPMSYGTEYVGSPAILNRMRDKINQSHGTHVAGIAAGNGGASNSIYKGVAYDSEIVLVSQALSQLDFIAGNNTKILDGINYIFNYANQMSKPSVINLSLGSHIGPHDGTSTFDQMCNSLVGTGKIIVGAAGNEGSDKIHTFKNLSTGNSQFSFIRFPYSNLPTKGIEYIDIWGQVGYNFEVAVNIYNVVTNQFESFTSYVSTSTNSSLNSTIYDNDTSTSPDACIIGISTESINTNNSKPHATIFVNNNQQDDIFRYILLEVKSNNGSVNTWLANDKNGIFSNLTEFNLNIPGTTDGDTNMTVGEIGGTGNSIISVGAYTSKNTWTSFSGQNQSLNLPNQSTPNVLNQIADFSSKGPTADGRIKPDITAPGNILASSVSRFDSNYLFTSPRTISGLTDGTNNWFFGMMEGTSMSSPMVAGIIALWLQAKPNLTVAQIKTILQNNSITAGLGSLPNNTWGSGKIDAYAGIQYINQFLNVETFDTSNNFIVYPNPTSSKVYFDNSNFNFKEVAIYNYLGQEVTKTSFSNNINNQEIDMSNLANGIYVLKFSNDGVSQSIKIIKE
jgi:subtilisin family serine protease